jgi:hypothetical protein
MTNRPHGYLCLPRVYSWRGWTWEDGMYSGPWPLRKDGEPRARAGRVFWKVWSEWEDLPEDEKQKTRVGGGCVRF